MLVTIGTTSWRAGTVPAASEVVFDGNFVYADDGFTPLMIWDVGLNNIREMTAGEKSALPGQLATAKARQAKAEATGGVDNGSLRHGDKFERICIAVAQVGLDGINAERACLTAMNSAVQGAASLAALKVAFAAISYPPQINGPQLVAAVKAKIAATAE